MQTLRLSGVIRESIVDGPGIRFVVFAQGCTHNCAGCHNPATHDLAGGYISSVPAIVSAVRENPLLCGVTLSGGEPFLQAGAFANLAKEVHKLNLNVITYTGYTIEQLMDKIDQNPGWEALLSQTDTLIDGPFVQAQKSLMLKFRGSANQRVIDPRQSLALGRAVEKEF